MLQQLHANVWRLFAVLSLAELVRNTRQAEDDIPGPFYCTFCTVYFQSQEAIHDHCLSSEHKFNFSSDKERQWNYRAPPWNVSDGNFKLCDKWVCKVFLQLHCSIVQLQPVVMVCTVLLLIQIHFGWRQPALMMMMMMMISESSAYCC